MVEELPINSEGMIVRSAGDYRSENADISSESSDENSECRKFKVSSVMSIIRG